MCMKDWVTLLYTWNYHILNQLYANKFFFKKGSVKDLDFTYLQTSLLNGPLPLSSSLLWPHLVKVEIWQRLAPRPKTWDQHQVLGTSKMESSTPDVTPCSHSTAAQCKEKAGRPVVHWLWSPSILTWLTRLLGRRHHFPHFVKDCEVHNHSWHS